MLLFMLKMDKVGLSHLRSTRYSPAALMTCLRTCRVPTRVLSLLVSSLGSRKASRRSGEQQAAGKCSSRPSCSLLVACIPQAQWGRQTLRAVSTLMRPRLRLHTQHGEAAQHLLLVAHHQRAGRLHGHADLSRTKDSQQLGGLEGRLKLPELQVLRRVHLGEEPLPAPRHALRPCSWGGDAGHTAGPPPAPHPTHQQPGEQTPQTHFLMRKETAAHFLGQDTRAQKALESVHPN